MSYQESDQHFMDYQLWPFKPMRRHLRGPKPDLTRPFLACIGSAHSFGRFCEYPYPTLLGKELGLEVLNLGCAGEGPGFILGKEEALAVINRAQFVVVQMTSARSMSNSVFEAPHNTAQIRRRDEPDSPLLQADPAYHRYLRTASEKDVVALRDEIRNEYVETMHRLLDLITPPKILLWFSIRSPEYSEGTSSLTEYWGEFPHFVDRRTVSRVQSSATQYVEVVTKRGLPQPLRTKDGHETHVWLMDEVMAKKINPDAAPVTHNKYYPSPEMHMDAAQALLNSLQFTQDRSFGEAG